MLTPSSCTATPEVQEHVQQMEGPPFTAMGREAQGGSASLYWQGNITLAVLEP